VADRRSRRAHPLTVATVVLAMCVLAGAGIAPAAGAAPVSASAIPGASRAPGSSAAGGSEEFLKPEDAFRLSARAIDERTLEASFDVAPGYYLYRDKLGFAVEPGKVSAAAPALPKGERKHDAFFGDVETYRGRVVVRLPLDAAQPGRTVVLRADSQGCADAGLCYPPMAQQLRVPIPAAGAGPGPVVEAHKKGWFN
jgi:thiol:disulfide interchange protein